MLAAADSKAACTGFVELMMNIIFDALTALDKTDQVNDQVGDQVKAQLHRK